MTTTQRDLPFGAGALRLRGRVWWMFYMDNAGGRHQVTTGKTDYNEARRLLAQLVLPIWRERMAAIEAIANGSGTKTDSKSGSIATGRDKRSRAAGGRGGRRKSSGSDAKNPTSPRARSRVKYAGAK